MASTAPRGTLLWVMIGVSTVTSKGEEEYRIAVIDDATYCSAQNTSAKGNAIMVKLKTKRAFHSGLPPGQRRFCKKASPISKTAAIKKRKPAACKGGTSRTSVLMASHVVPQMRHSATKPKILPRVRDEDGCGGT